MGRASEPTNPPEAWPGLLRLVRVVRRPLERFLAIQAASGIVLFAAAAVALMWANSPWASSYGALWHTLLGVRLGTLRFERSLEWYVNDGLMVIFFFVVGLEIRREIHCGELAEWRRAALPAAAAMGGMIAPAVLYLLLAREPAARAGWAVPMATDIAFAVGVLTLLGPRVPAALRVLLLALAVIDDLGAIVVIALFYSPALEWGGLVIALGGYAGIFALQRFGVRDKLVYILPAFIAWAGVYAAGVHPTIAGVIVGLITPVRAWHGAEGYLSDVKRRLAELEQADPATLKAHDLAVRLREIDRVRREALSPAEALIETLHPWVAFGIMPIFALANAGVAVGGVDLQGTTLNIGLATLVGLVAGKPIGILLACKLTTSIGLATLPTGLSTRHLIVLGIVAGIGFTMSLFIAQLAFQDPTHLSAAKLGVLLSSLITATLSLTLGTHLLPKTPHPQAAKSADEAESSTEL